MGNKVSKKLQGQLKETVKKNSLEEPELWNNLIKAAWNRVGIDHVVSFVQFCSLQID